MKLTSKTSCIRSIRMGEPKFLIHDGLIMAPRAGFEISKECPKGYAQVIQECLANGWLIPVAQVKDTELFWEAFKE